MIDIGEFMSSYLVNGYYHFNAFDLLDRFPIEAFEPIKDKDITFLTDDPEERYAGYTQVQRASLKILSLHLSRKYLSVFDHTLRFNDMWATSNPNTYGWHNDTMRCWKGFNSSVNCYFNDTDETIGGAFQSKPVSPPGRNEPEVISSVYPKYGDIIIINQNSTFVHRVTHSEQPRRMVAFNVAFHDFNPIS